jgi:hypothetical protein
VSKADQLLLLRVLKLEKARILAKKLDIQKPLKKYTDKEITATSHDIRKAYKS